MDERPQLRGDITLTPAGIDSRLTFRETEQILEIDLARVHFRGKADVTAFYDRCETRIGESGETLWFFLIHDDGLRVDPEAWVAYSARGRSLTLGHSMGTVRYDGSAETRAQIDRTRGTDAFDPNLLPTREAALARIRELPSQRRKRIVHEPNYTRADFEGRLAFFPDEGILEADFSDFTFHHSRDVKDFYDLIEEAILETGRKWFFLLNQNGLRIEPAAWVEFARRAKRLSTGAALGIVRYAEGTEISSALALHSATPGLRPNARNTREEALDRIAELKAGEVH
jgi:hypothetical protein